MGRFFSRVSTKGEAPQIASFSNLMSFYSLLLFLIAIPFVLIVALVWLNGILGFSTWIIAGFAVLVGVLIWRLSRRWGRIRADLAAQGADVKDIVREAARDGKDVEVSLLNGLLTFRYQGSRWPRPHALTYSGLEPLALEAPVPVTIEAAPRGTGDAPRMDARQLRQELEGFIRLRDSGIITPEEFDHIKSHLLGELTEESNLPETGEL